MTKRLCDECHGIAGGSCPNCGGSGWTGEPDCDDMSVGPDADDIDTKRAWMRHCKELADECFRHKAEIERLTAEVAASHECCCQEQNERLRAYVSYQPCACLDASGKRKPEPSERCRLLYGHETWAEFDRSVATRRECAAAKELDMAKTQTNPDTVDQPDGENVGCNDIILQLTLDDAQRATKAIAIHRYYGHCECEPDVGWTCGFCKREDASRFTSEEVIDRYTDMLMSSISRGDYERMAQ